MDMTWSIMEITSIGGAGLLADAIGIQRVYYLGGGLLVFAGPLGILLLGRSRFQIALSVPD